MIDQNTNDTVNTDTDTDTTTDDSTLDTITQNTPASKAPKCRAMVYVQQLAHLPAQTYDDLKVLVEDHIQPRRWAMILHDHDVDENGAPVDPHVHVMMDFKNQRYISAIAKLLGDQPQYVQRWKGPVNRGFAYLVHHTASARNKYQYDPATVDSNFDFCDLCAKMDFLERATKAPHDQDYVPALLNLLLDGVIDRDTIISLIYGSELGKYASQIDRVWAQRMENEAKEWRKQMAESGKAIFVGWLYGAAGTGKTSFASELAARSEEGFFVTGSSRDPFQGYKGQHIVIIDELRPGTFPEYSDLLRLLDPFGSDVMAPSRYQDKAVMAETIYITSPYNPVEFYNAMFSGEPKSQHNVDSMGQLLRRLSLVIEMSDDYITLMEFDDICGGYYKPSAEPPRPNPYSQKARKGPPVDSVAAFNSLFVSAVDDSQGSDSSQTDEDTTPTE